MDAKQLTVSDLDNFVKQIKEKRAQAEEIGETLKVVNKEIASLEAKAVSLLKELDREKYASPSGTISIIQKWRVNLPASDRDKMALFEHFRSRGIFEKYATVNSNSLNSLYLSDWEEAKKEGKGMEFFMPGIEAPKLHESIRFTGAK